MRRGVGPLQSAEETHASSALRRLCLLSTTAYTPVAALALDETQLTREALTTAGVTWDSVMASGIEIRTLYERHGFDTVASLVRIGLDAIELSDASLVRSLVAVYGLDAVRQTLVSTPSDAVAVAGTDGCLELGLGLRELVALCAGAPVQAAAVIGASGPPRDVAALLDAPLLLDTGLRGTALIELGLNTIELVEQMQDTPSPQQLRQLGLAPVLQQRVCSRNDPVRK